MIQISLGQVAAILECETAHDNITFNGISTDSRQIAAGMLFAALPGRKFDGHDHIDHAEARGAVAMLVSRPVTTGVPVLLVDDVLVALGKLARYWRNQCAVKVVGITGSNGKTTVKEMIASVLRKNASVLATDGNFNNELGLPLTLFKLSASHDYAVLEMGASNPGDISYLADIACPDVGVITNVGPAHLRGFIDVEGVARAKGELLASLPEEGTAIINAAEPWVEMWLSMNTAGNVCFFNGEDDSHTRAKRRKDQITVITRSGDFSLNLPLPGEHNLTNALAAASVCLSLDVPFEDIKAGLESVTPVPGRLCVVPTHCGWTVIDDTYNANPASLYAALQVLANQSGEPWLVLGDMKELGADSRKIHAELGDAARSLGVKRLFALGDASTATVDAFGAMATHYNTREGLIDALLSQLRPGVACLVKGSRTMGMEHVVKAIANDSDYRDVGG